MSSKIKVDRKQFILRKFIYKKLKDANLRFVIISVLIISLLQLTYFKNIVYSIPIFSIVIPYIYKSKKINRDINYLVRGIFFTTKKNTEVIINILISNILFLWIVKSYLFIEYSHDMKLILNGIYIVLGQFIIFYIINHIIMIISISSKRKIKLTNSDKKQLLKLKNRIEKVIEDEIYNEKNNSNILKLKKFIKSIETLIKE